MAYLAVGVRGALVAVFVVAVAGKLRPAGFAGIRATVADWTGWPVRAAQVAAAAVVLSEATVVVALAIGGVAAVAGFAIAAVTLTVVTAGLLRVLRRGEPVAPCRCFGSSDTRPGSRHVVRNVVLLAAAVAGLLASVEAGPAAPAGVLLAAGTGIVTGLLVTRLDDLAALVGREGA